MTEAYTIVQHGHWLAEIVPFEDLREGTYSYYLVDPFTVESPNYAPPQPRNLVLQEPDTLVWVIWPHNPYQDNPFLKPVRREKWDGPGLFPPCVSGLVNMMRPDGMIDKVEYNKP